MPVYTSFLNFEEIDMLSVSQLNCGNFEFDLSESDQGDEPNLNLNPLKTGCLCRTRIENKQRSNRN